MSLFLHNQSRLLRTHEYTRNICLNHFLKIIIRSFHEWSSICTYGGVVDKNVYRTELIDGFFKKTLHVVFYTYVCL